MEFLDNAFYGIGTEAYYHFSDNSRDFVDIFSNLILITMEDDYNWYGDRVFDEVRKTMRFPKKSVRGLTLEEISKIEDSNALSMFKTRERVDFTLDSNGKIFKV